MDTRICRLHSAHDLRLEKQTLRAPGRLEVQVAVGAGGICGSDLHYYHDGGIGQIRVREPIILGHEAAGRVVEVGEGAEGLSVGDLVAINPSLPCNRCKFCRKGEKNHCAEMKFMGSAYRTPHEQGMFRDLINIPAVRAHRFSNPVPLREAACAEPLAVCLHAASRAPELGGARVLVTGAGPIGALMTSVVAQANPAELVVTDLHDHPLSIAQKLGAMETINVTNQSEKTDVFTKGKGHFDVVFECTGASAAIRGALEMLRPGGTMVLVGVAGEVALPLNVVVSKEVRMVGTHRFHPEFSDAVQMIDAGLIDVTPIISRTFDASDVAAAFAAASDRSSALKVQLSFQSIE
ncbi:MAG: L-idonate 5-dehydrogenase [Pseudomonadota bacterium]